MNFQSINIGDLVYHEKTDLKGVVTKDEGQHVQVVVTKSSGASMMSFPKEEIVIISKENKLPNTKENSKSTVNNEEMKRIHFSDDELFNKSLEVIRDLVLLGSVTVFSVPELLKLGKEISSEFSKYVKQGVLDLSKDKTAKVVNDLKNNTLGMYVLLGVNPSKVVEDNKEIKEFRKKMKELELNVSRELTPVETEGATLFITEVVESVLKLNHNLSKNKTEFMERSQLLKKSYIKTLKEEAVSRKNIIHKKERALKQADLLDKVYEYMLLFK